MKDSKRQDQRIAREFGKYRLVPPSPDLHDRVLQTAREAMASRNEEIHWTGRGLRACGAFRQQILASASVLMLILGVVIQHGGGQSALADSLERLTVTAAISGSLHRAASMDCTILKPGAGDAYSQYRVRWSAAGVTRMDISSANGTKQTLWISNGTVSVADYEDGTLRPMAVASIPSKWQPLMELLTPSALAQHIEQYGLMRAESQDGAGPDEFLFVGKENQQVIETAIDVKTYCPITLNKYRPDSAQGKEREYLEQIRFQWNNPIPQKLFVPESSAIKRQVE